MTSPRGKPLSAANQAHALVRILRTNHGEARRTIMQYLPFAAQYAVACAVPGVVCARYPFPGLLDVAKMAVRSAVHALDAGDVSPACADFLIGNAERATITWIDDFWVRCMTMATTYKSQSFVRPLAAWAERNDVELSGPHLVGRSLFEWWGNCVARRGPRGVVLAFIEQFGAALVRPWGEHRARIPTCVNQMLGGGCDWATIEQAYAMLVDASGCHMDDAPPLVLDEYIALQGMHPSVLQHLDDNHVTLPLVPEFMTAWDILEMRELWDDTARAALPAVVQRHGHPTRDHELLAVVLRRSRGNYACYDWIEQHIVGRPDGNEARRRNLAARYVLHAVADHANKPDCWHLATLWRLYHAQFAAMDADALQDVLRAYVGINYAGVYARFAGALCAWWPQHADAIAEYVCRVRERVVHAPERPAERTYMLQRVRAARAQVLADMQRRCAPL